MLAVQHYWRSSNLQQQMPPRGVGEDKSKPCCFASPVINECLLGLWRGGCLPVASWPEKAAGGLATQVQSMLDLRHCAAGLLLLVTDMSTEGHAETQCREALEWVCHVTFQPPFHQHCRLQWYQRLLR